MQCIDIVIGSNILENITTFIFKILLNIRDVVMHIKVFKVSEQAVAGVIEAMLLVALIAIIMSTIQLIYIPQMMEQRESEHMDTIANQFSSLNTVMNIQSIAQSDMPVFSIVTLGSKELPYFITGPAAGELSIPQEECIVINVTSSHNSFILSLNSIKFKSYNLYFVDQTYIIEAGAIIVKQPNSNSVMRVDPSLSVKNENGIITLKFFMLNITGTPGKKSTHGYGRCFVRTSYLNNYSFFIANITSIRINTKYPEAWNDSLYDMLNSYGIIWYTGNGTWDGYVDIDQKISYVEIIVKSMYNIQFDLYLEITDISTQIGAGWIK